MMIVPPTPAPPTSIPDVLRAYLAASGLSLRVPRDDGRPFQLIMGSDSTG